MQLIGGSELNPNLRSTLDARGLSRVLYQLNSELNVTLKNLNIINGQALDTAFIGGTIFHHYIPVHNRFRGSGVILCSKHVSIYNVTIDNSHYWVERVITPGLAAGIVTIDDFFIDNLLISNSNGFCGSGVLQLVGTGTLTNSAFINNSVIASFNVAGGAIQANSSSYPINISNCLFENNFISEPEGRSHGGAICLLNTVFVYNCTFINNVADQGGAITIHTDGHIGDCKFYNNTATSLYGGAISTGFDELDINVTISNSYFENNQAPIGGAIQLRGHDIEVINCNFVNNSAIQGGACFSEGLTQNIENCTFDGNNATKNLNSNIVLSQYYRDLDLNGAAIFVDYGYLSVQSSKFYNHHSTSNTVYVKGNYTSIIQSLFENNSGSHGAAVFIEGDFSNIFNSNFYYNGAIDGGAIYIKGNDAVFNHNIFVSNNATNGAAIYIKGNFTIVNASEFYNHISEEGTVYIEGDNSNVLNCTFKFNNATDGAAVHIIGSNSLVKDSNFEYNTAVNGGAIYFNGNYANVRNSNFLKNIATPLNDTNTGLGGAIYLRGDYFNIEDNFFDLNVARNGSAIYNNGIHFTLTNDKFGENQAWSYTLTTIAIPSSSIYNESDIVIKAVLVGGDNLINAIYNAQSTMYVTFNNVTYITKRYGLITTGMGVKPVDGAENSMEGTLVYQDSREDYQIINLTVTGPNGLVYPNTALRTDIYGNVSVTLPKGLAPGWYNVLSEHPEDNLYKYINNASLFLISDVDIGVTKTSNLDELFLGENVVWTIVVTNHGTVNATNVTMKDLLPEGLTYISSIATVGSYNPNAGNWNIGTLAGGQSVTLNITATTTKLGIINNIAVVNCTEPDINLTNNRDNKTIKVMGLLNKTVDNPTPVVGQVIKYNLTITNNGHVTISENVTLVDSLPDGLEYAGNYVLVGGHLVNFTQNANKLIWVISDITTTQPMVITVDIKVTKAGTWTNNLTLNNHYTVNETVNTIDPNKTVDNPTPVVGEVIKYNLTVVNTGNITITDYVTLVDSLPDGLEYAGSYVLAGGRFVNFTHNGKVLTWVVTNITNTVPLVITVSVNVTKAGTWTNNLTLNNNYTVNETVNTVDPNKTVDNPTPVVGEVIKYNLTVVNTGNMTISKNITLVDSLPDGLEYAGNYVIVGGRVVSFTQNGNKLIWVVSDVTTTQPMVITVDIKVIKAGTWTNNLTLNNHYTVNETVNTIDSNKTVDNPTPVVGEVIKYNLTVVNNGNVAISKNITLVDSLPNGLEYAGNYVIVGGRVVNFTQNGKVLTWIVTNITNSAPLVITVDIRVIKAGTWTNNLTLNNNYTVNETITTVDSNKTVDNPTPVVGEVIKYNLTVVNTGNVTIRDYITLVDSLPDGLEYAGRYVIAGGRVVSFTQNGNKLIWVVSDVTTTQPMVITVDIKVTKAGTWTNNLTLNNNYTVNKTINTIDPNKTVDNPTPKVNEIVNYNLTVVNTGNVTIRDYVTLVDTLSDGLEYAGSYVLVGGDLVSFTRNGKVLTWIVTNITTSVPLVITVSVNVTKAGTWTNTLTVGNKNYTANVTTPFDEPDIPDEPDTPDTPVDPVDPVTPDDPVDPVDPVSPDEPQKMDAKVLHETGNPLLMLLLVLVALGITRLKRKD